MGQGTEHIDLPELRERLSRAGGESIWRSLHELAPGDAVRAALYREFPPGASEWDDGVSRRSFLRVMGASLALAGVYGCSEKPDRKIVPYVSPPEELVPGKPLYFASAHTLAGLARGIVVESNEGRPTKIEGNPEHPASLGASDVFMQASVLGLYDPDRSQSISLAGNVSSWSDFLIALRERLGAKKASGGQGIRLLSGAITSPTLAGQIAEFIKQYPSARWHQHEPAARVTAEGGSAVYAFDSADVIVSLDSDFLFSEAGSLKYAREFSNRRRVRKAQQTMSRLYVVETTFSITGSMADHRLAVRPSQMEALASRLEALVQGQAPAGAGKEDHWVAAAAADLIDTLKRGGTSLVVAGPWQSPGVQAAARRINLALGNVSKSVRYIAPVEVGGAGTLAELAADLAGGQADTLFIFDSNPAYTAPADLDFKNVLEKFSNARQSDGYANFSVHVGLYGSREDETAFRSQWHIPLSHDLESWSDARAFDGTVSLIQPMIAPLYSSKSPSEMLEAMLGRPERSAYEAVRSHWSESGVSDPSGFEAWWESALKAGVISNTATDTTQPVARTTVPAAAPASQPAAGQLEVVFRPDPTVYDGRFANNGWLQELPKPLTKLTWDNAALIGFKLAEENGLADGDVVRLTLSGRSIEAAVVVLPGHPDGVVTLTLGYGRDRVGQVGYDVEASAVRGYNAYALRGQDALWWSAGLTLQKTGRHEKLVFTRSHNVMDGLSSNRLGPHAVADPSMDEKELEMGNRRIVRTATLEQFRKNPGVIRDLGVETEKRTVPLTLYKPEEWDYSKAPHKWGMSIDMQSCIGCNACVTACQAENNIPVVGKEAVSRQREMHWIRIDDYFAGTVDEPAVYHQPVPCMQCENAPCELVCPVGATTHSAEGINEMTYNRCVGTRYCSNNCPYKVRRFNFFNYETTSPTLALQHNPEVTVRSRGVMEKCNYCVQRVNRTRIDREKFRVQLEDRIARAAGSAEAEQLKAQLADESQAILDDLQTACQQSCPTQAIVFGDLNDRRGHDGKGSVVWQLKQEPLDYPLLAELSTQPRTTYMARIRNLNPALAPAPVKQEGPA